MATKKKPQGKFAAGKVEAPRKVTINGETHYLVYVTPDEAKGLKKAGGSGQAGPKGIPAFPRGSVSKDEVDKAKAKTASKPAPAKTVTNTGSRGSEKSTPAETVTNTGSRGSEKSTPAETVTNTGSRGSEKSTPAETVTNTGSRGSEKSTPAETVTNTGSRGSEKKAAPKVVTPVVTPKVVTPAPKVVIDPKVVTPPVVTPPVVTDVGVASVVAPTVAPPVATGKYQPTIDPKTGAVTDRLGNPVVTNAKGYGYFDPITGLAVTPWTDSINGGGPGYGGAALGSGGGAALDTNKDNYISEAEIAAGKAKGLELEQNAWSKFGTGLGITPLGSGIDPTGIAGFADSGILGFARKLGAPGYVRPDSSIAPGQELNKWWEADKNALGFAYGTQDEISQRRADAVRAAAAAAAIPERNSDNDNGPVAPTVPTVTTPPNYTANAQQAFMPIPNPDYNPADPMSLAYLTNPSYEELLAYRNSGPTLGMLTGFTRQFAKGGIANLVKDGGNEKTIISDAIRAVEGKMSERDAAISLAKFVKAHGEPALRDLVDKVSSGEYADTRERFANGENGMVRGPGNGSGTDDKVPATIDGEQDVLLADGEMVLRKKTTDAIEKAYPGLLDRINAAEGDAPKVLAKALDFIEGRNRRG
jgi:hypothetical protein